MGKLLTLSQSFDWSNTTLDRRSSLNNFDLAIRKAISMNDKIFSHHYIYDPNFQNSIFSMLFNEDLYEFSKLKLRFPWLTPDAFTTLTALPNFLGPETPLPSKNWEDFSAEFYGDHISMIGIEDSQSYKFPLVYDIPTHDVFYQNLADTFDFEQQKVNFKFFKENYVPRPKPDASSIFNSIAKGLEHSDIKAFHSPKTDPQGNILHGEQYHVHIKIKKTQYALNINGTWKHNVKPDSNDKIPNQICTRLVEWGFLLPDEYYG